MDIRVLQYFLTVAREQSITKAAEVLHMTQPPLSRQLKDLEIELGKQLFIRGNKKITLTEDGILLQKRAEEMVDLMEKTKSELSGSNKDISGEVYIGGGETEAMSYIAEAAKVLQNQYPLIHYNIYSGDANHIMEKLDKGLLDFGLLVEPVDIIKYDYIKLPIKDSWGVLMNSSSPLSSQSYICAKDLWDKPLILSHQTAFSSEMANWFQKDMTKLNIVAKYELLYNASHLVKKGFGYAVALDNIININDDSTLCFRPFYPILEAGLCIIWKKHQIFSKAADIFLKQLQKELLKI